MSKLIIMQGLPASGKSTWAKEWVKQDPKNRIRINRDDLRAMMTVGYDPEVDTFIKSIERRLVLAMLESKNVVVDDTNLKAQDIVDWQSVAEQAHIQYGKSFDSRIKCMRMNTPMEECIHRNNERTIGRVPTDAIKIMANSKYLNIPVKEMYGEAIKEIGEQYGQYE